MTRDDRVAEDVAGLFRKFGGDPKRYQEFDAVPEVGPAACAPVPEPKAAPTEAQASLARHSDRP
jgi:hypothetical protein